MVHDIIIRPAIDQDSAAVRRLVQNILSEFNFHYNEQSSESDLKNIGHSYQDAGGLFLVAQDQMNNIVGTVGLLRINDTEAKLRKMYVAHSHRGHKLGKLLLETVLTYAKQSGFKTIYLETVHTMHAAIGLYQAFGFSTITLAASSPRCDLVMVKHL